MLAVTSEQKGFTEEAIRYYQKTVSLNPDFVEAHINLGNLLKNKRQINEAIHSYQKANQLKPGQADILFSLGTAFQAKGLLDKAINCYQKALQINPDLAEAYYNMGIAFQEQGQNDEVAIEHYKKALGIKRDFAAAYSYLTHQLQRTCAWQEFEAMKAELDNITKKALDTKTKPAETPFMSIARNDDISLNSAVAKACSLDIENSMSHLNIRFPFDGRRTDKTKRIIGYLSNDFRNHPIGHLTRSLFKLHNRDEFKIFGYSYGKNDESYYRKAIQNDFDKFIDIFSFDDAAAARCIYEDQVDILVDLTGYTTDSRLSICALCPAPIQVSYLGLPGTTGADFFDYIVTDKIVTPEDHQPYYSEKFVYMPHCYQVNDHTQHIPNKDLKKRDVGLPESSFAFCSFVQPYKIDRKMFDVWMRILKKVSEGVLWLIVFGSKLAEDNLRREAEARGVQPERLIFADSLPKSEHLERMRVADLALDTRIYNGHTTTSDALWVGVPVVTLQGSHFASRVSSSILSAIGMPELITYNIEEYETLAVRLAHNPDELQELRQKIAENRLVKPLFDTPRFVKNLEKAYKEMWAIYGAGELPRMIEVLDN
jgi:protein O-GlcNAc transferase